jgi:3-isopropylmalate/(R)-2-methylmalate dehydratase small subunit
MRGHYSPAGKADAMEKFITLTASACSLGLANVDTDQILPARYLKVKRAAGFGQYLFHDIRRDASGEMRDDFPLNQPRCREAKILVAGRNFGGGSSREAAVYALCDSGIRCVIAPSFGDIFSQNATKNGLLTAVVSDQAAAEIAAAIDAAPDLPLTVELENQQILRDTESWEFAIDPARRQRLLNGWDDIAMTQSFKSQIEAFRRCDKDAHPWKYPALE